MKVYTKVRMDWDGNVLEEESYEYEGPVAQAGKDSGNTTETEPWVKQQPYLKEIFGEAQGFYQNQDLWPSYYWGNTVAPTNPIEMTALQQIAQTSMGPMPEQVAQMANANQWLAGPAMYAESNPYLGGYIEAATEPVIRQFNEDVLPEIRSGAIQAGQYGGSRQGIAEGIAMDRLQQNLLNTTSGITNEAYQRGLDNMIKATALMPATMQAGLMPGQAMAGVGQGLRTMDQLFIDSYINRHGYNENLPLEMLVYYNNLVNGMYGGTSTASYQQSLGQQLAGAAGAGLGTYGMLAAIPGAGQLALPAAILMGGLSLF